MGRLLEQLSEQLMVLQSGLLWEQLSELRAVALALAESEGEVLMMQASQDDRLPSSVGEVDVRQKKSVSDMIGMFRKGFMGFVGVDFGLLGLRVCQCRGDVI